jgi:hypothetical protein
MLRRTEIGPRKSSGFTERRTSQMLLSDLSGDVGGRKLDADERKLIDNNESRQFGDPVLTWRRRFRAIL